MGIRPFGGEIQKNKKAGWAAPGSGAGALGVPGLKILVEDWPTFTKRFVMLAVLDSGNMLFGYFQKEIKIYRMGFNGPFLSGLAGDFIFKKFFFMKTHGQAWCGWLFPGGICRGYSGLIWQAASLRAEKWMQHISPQKNLCRVSGRQCNKWYGILGLLCFSVRLFINVLGVISSSGFFYTGDSGIFSRSDGGFNHLGHEAGGPG